MGSSTHEVLPAGALMPPFPARKTGYAIEDGSEERSAREVLRALARAWAKSRNEALIEPGGLE
jgi:hypothetical protein